MIEIEITRLIAAAVAAFLLGYACYVAAYVKHKNEIRDELNKRAVATKESGLAPYETGEEKIRIEKTSTWYLGYRLALVGLIVVSTAVGWAAAWAVGQEHILTWVEDGCIAAAAAIIGGFCLDKWIIHPIADGEFFEKVEDPIVQRFLQDAAPAVEDKVKEKKPGFLERRKAKKAAKNAVENTAPEEDPVTKDMSEDELIGSLSFSEKVALIERLRKTL